MTLLEEFTAAYARGMDGLPLCLVDLRLEVEAPFPLAFPGAFFRGVLGNELRRRCPGRDGEGPCPPGRECPWCDLFQPAPARTGGEHWSGALATIPVPYAVQVTPEEWRRGRLRVLLLGRATGHVPAVVDAFRRAGERGLGRERVRMIVVEREARETTAGREVADLLHEWGDRPLALRAISPLRLKREGRWCREPAARDLVVAVARRVSALVFHHGTGDPLPAPPRDWLEGLGKDLLPGSRWRWVRRERWSSRQGQRYPVDGVLGGASFPSADPVARQLLAAAQVLGVGKGIAYGLGRVLVVPAPPP